MRVVFAPAHPAAGGMLQFTPRHGSGLQAPLEQPNVHAVSVGEYEQTPAPAHVPLAEYVRRVDPVRQLGEGGVLHVVSVGAYVHVPPLHVPVAANVRRAVPLAHVVAGGMLHITPLHGSPMHAPPVQPFAQVVSVGGYPQMPLPLHAPVAENVRSTVPLMHADAGGELQTRSTGG